MSKIKSVIIGGTRGIGLALAKRWSEEGQELFIVSRNIPVQEDQLTHATYFSMDLTQTKELPSKIADLMRATGDVNNLVFFQRYRGEEDSWDGELSVSLTSTKIFIDCFVVQGSFSKKDSPSITVIASVASRFIAGNQTLAYHVGKAGLIQLVRYYAVRLGPLGIRVNAISSSTVVKDENRTYYEEGNKKLKDLLSAICPLGRMATSVDLLNTVDFFASEKAGFITGQELFVDGGLSLKWHESLAQHVKGTE
jgi:NAD(P)-dependent dehydrogenase (short-subunit alcohol dehydrogenase family)